MQKVRKRQLLEKIPLNKSSKPKVSIILTSFNHGRYLRESIDSVVNQIFTDFELIIWDDASSDDSWDIIQSYQDQRIKAYRNDINRRAIYGVNKAISEITQGEYIAIHHSDDIWEPEKLKLQVEFLDRHSNFGAVFTNALIVDEEGNPLPDSSHTYSNIFDQPNRTRHSWIRHFFLHGNALCHPSVLIRKNCYYNCGLYHYGFSQLGDFDMWIRLALQYEIHVLEEKLIRFRIRNCEANSSGNTPESRVRLAYEQTLLLRNYLQISDYYDIIKIFPEACKYLVAGQVNAQYGLAMAVLELKPNVTSVKFALDLLFKLLNEQKLVNDVSLLNKDYISYVTKLDPMQLLTIDHLHKLIFDRDEIITELSKTVAERDNQIVNLSQAIVERDGRIGSISEAVFHRDGEIVKLSQAVVDRDRQIASLSQALEEQEAKVASGRLESLTIQLFQLFLRELKGTEIVSPEKALKEFYAKINVLGQWIAERDSHIGELSQTLSERDSEIATGRIQLLIIRFFQLLLSDLEDSEIVSLENALVEQSSDVNGLSQLINQRDYFISQESQILSDRNRQNANERIQSLTIRFFRLLLSDLKDSEIVSLENALREKDSHVNNLSQSIVDRDSQINELSQKLNEQDANERIQSLTIRFFRLLLSDLKDSEIVSLENALREKDSHINNLSQSVVDRDSQINELSQKLNEQDRQVASGHTKSLVARFFGSLLIELKNSKISTLEQGLADRDSKIRGLSHLLSERDAKINSLEEFLVNRDSEINILNQLMGERDKQIAELSNEVLNITALTEELQSKIADKDDRIILQNQRNFDLDELVKNLGQQLVERDIQVSELTEKIIQSSVWAVEVEAELNIEREKVLALHKSHSWMITKPFRELMTWINRLKVNFVAML